MRSPRATRSSSITARLGVSLRLNTVCRFTDTSTFCPYKGTARYWTLALADGTELVDAVWSYEEPFPECGPVAGYVSFWGDDVEVHAAFR